MIKVNGNEVTMSLAEYEQLISDQRLLHALKNAGVDNWDGWDDAVAEFHDGEDE